MGQDSCRPQVCIFLSLLDGCSDLFLFQPERSSNRTYFFVSGLIHSSTQVESNPANPRYNNTGHLLSFVNLNYFIHRLNHPEERLFIQPAFIFAVLAMAKLMKSSSIELGVQGVRAAITYSVDANNALAEAIRNNWTDYNLAEAALVRSITLLLPLIIFIVYPRFLPFLNPPPTLTILPKGPPELSSISTTSSTPFL